MTTLPCWQWRSNNANEGCDMRYAIGDMRALLRAVTCVILLSAVISVPAQAGPPITLQQSIAYALENNPRMKLYQKKVSAAREEVEVARVDLLPKLKFKTGYRKQSKEGYEAQKLAAVGITTDDEIYAFGFKLEQLIYDGGYTPSEVKYSKRRVDSEASRLKLERQNITFEVTEAYYRVLHAQKIVELSEEALRTAEEHLQVTRVKFKEHAKTRSDLLAAEVELLERERDLMKAKNGHELAVLAFNNVLGRDLDAEVEVADTLASVEANIGRDVPVKGNLEGHPELLQVRADIEAAREGFRMAQAGFYRPRFKLEAEWEKKDDFWPPDQIGWRVDVGTEFPLYKGRESSHEGRKANALLVQAEAMEDVITKKVDMEIRQAELGLKEAEESTRITRKIVEQTQETLRITDVAYKAGTATLEDVLKSQTALTKARTNHVRALCDYEIARAKLKLALGRG